MAIALSGSLVITGSIFATQGITGSFSGNATSASYATTASYALRTAGVNSLTASTGIYIDYNSSTGGATIYNQGVVSITGSANQIASSPPTTQGLVTLFLPQGIGTTSQVTFGGITGSVLGTASNATLFNTRDSSTFANTGSNTFTGPQYVSQASNAISFTSTASLYTDGGLRVSKDSFVSGTAYFNNVVVYGTSSIQYITSSQVNFGTNIITVNTDTPAVRFGGLAVFDSGSTQLTGSILWDSEKNHWIYSNPSGSTYNSAMLMNGPRNTGSLGSEQGTTACAMMIGQGGDHITSSMIYSYGNATCFYGTSYVSASGDACFASTVCAPAFIGGTLSGTTIYGSTAVCSPVGKFTSCIDAGSGTFSGNIGITVANTPQVLLTHSNTSKTFLMAVDGSNAFFRANSTNNILFQYAGGTTALTINGSTGAATFTTTTSNGITITTNDVATLKMTSSGGATKNWGFATTLSAASDFGIYQSTSVGGDPISAGSAKLYFSGTGAATFACTVQANGGNITSFSSTGAAAFGNGMNIYTQPGTYTAGHGGILQFQNEDVITGGIRAIRDGGSWGGALLFYTHNTSAGNTFDTTFVERMRITSDGNVGIGTCTPSAKLHINGSTGASTYKGFAYTYAGSETLTNEVLFQAVVGGYSSNLPIFLFKDERSDQGTTQRIFEIQGGRSGVGTILTTLANGNVGIGTASPCYKLDIRNASGTGAQTIVSVVNKTNDSNTGAFIGFGDAYTDTVSPYLFAARVGGTREGAGDGGYMSFYTRPTSGFEYERMRITAGGIACFACQTCTPQSVITSGFYSNSNMIIITNDVVDGRKTILNNTPVSIFQICKPAGAASSASYSLLGGQLYINLGLRYNGGYNTTQTIIYPFLINSTGTGNISLVLGTPTCLTGFNNTGETTSFGISLCGSSSTTATVIVCANTPNFTIDGSTMITVSMVANRTALLDEPITVFKI